jgi:DNA-binding NarL/FixJ family response regulator
MDSKVRLSICHRNRLFRECLSVALAVTDQMEITVMDEPINDATMASWNDGPDLLLIDANLPDMMAFRFVHNLITTVQAPRTILIVSSSSPDLIESCLQAGAQGCVLDDDTLEDLRQAIANVLAGRSYCSPRVAHRLFTPIGGLAQPSRWSTHGRDYQLTGREVEILRLIAHQNFSNKQIARELRLSIHTVKNHVHSIIEKLCVEDRQTAVRHALRHGLLTGPLA